jgi:hypothetical protein
MFSSDGDGTNGYNLRLRRLKVSATSIDKVFGAFIRPSRWEPPRKDDFASIETLCKKLASFVAREANEPRSLATAAAWIVAEGVGGLMTISEFKHEAKKILGLIDTQTEVNDDDIAYALIEITF